MTQSLFDVLTSSGSIKRGQKTKARIIEHSERCFAELGYDSTSIAEIARKSGLSGASVVSHHFRSKYQILKACAGYRSFPFNIYRRVLLEHLLGLNLPEFTVHAAAILRPYAWCNRLVGRTGPASIGVCVGRFYMENPEAKWTHRGDEHLYFVAERLSKVIAQSSYLEGEQLQRRAQVFGVSVLSQFALIESKLEVDGAPGVAINQRWDAATAEAIKALSACFGVSALGLDEVLEATLSLEQKIGEPDWAYLAVIGGVIP